MMRFCAFLFCFAACYTSPKSELAVASRWVGAPSDKLIYRLGYPDKTIALPSGNSVLVYSDGVTAQTPMVVNTFNYGSGYSSSVVTGGQTVSRWCVLRFEVNRAGDIVRWTQEGNACAD